MDSFSYEPLDLSKKEIRLLILNPSEGSDQLSGRIIHSDILSRSEKLGHFNDHVNGYEALSYEWGTSQVDEDALECIALDGKEFRLRSNLYYALHRLRPSEKPRILWVDAMCIDKRDNRERNPQVNLMRMIYAQADRVIIWLGNKFHGLNPLRRMKDFVEHVFTISHSEEELEKLWFDGGSGDVEFKYFAVWYYLPALSYWSRLWIIQEFVLAKDLVLYLDDAIADPRT